VKRQKNKFQSDTMNDSKVIWSKKFKIER